MTKRKKLESAGDPTSVKITVTPEPEVPNQPAPPPIKEEPTVSVTPTPEPVVPATSIAIQATPQPVKVQDKPLFQQAAEGLGELIKSGRLPGYSLSFIGEAPARAIHVLNGVYVYCKLFEHERGKKLRISFYQALPTGDRVKLMEAFKGMNEKVEEIGSYMRPSSI